ncbi:glycosyltransferase family 4 protein [Natronomonas marina]|uniref:glycosyltransferase family 4 protein n=1 Tax=Natronomonas marina TaxID=2961939 RepID=UPI0020C9D3E6|nr:glycosyltransferase family 4 protein [Natronomonas marina]
MDKNLEICFIAPYLYKYLDEKENKPAGGAQRQQYLLASELKNRGYSIKLLVEDVGQDKEQSIEDMLVVSGCPTNISSFFKIPQQICLLWHAIYTIDADIYYVRGAPRLTIAVGIGCKLLGKNFVFCAANDSDIFKSHLQEKYTKPVRKAYFWTIRNADTVISQTNRQRSQMESDFNIDSVRIPNGYTIPDSKCLLHHEERQFVLWVGSSDPNQKRPEKFLKLAKSLPEEDFVMISKPHPGREKYHDELKNRAENIDNIYFLGTTPPDLVHEYHRRAKVFINTSAYEGFPNTFLEAWRFATPIVSLSFDVDQILRTKEVGMHSGSQAQLEEDTELLLSAPERRNQMGQNGRELLKEKYSLSSVTDRYEEVFKCI